MSATKQPPETTEALNAKPVNKNNTKTVGLAAVGLLVLALILGATYMAGARSHRLAANAIGGPAAGRRQFSGGRGGRMAPTAAGSVTAIDDKTITLKVSTGDAVKVTTSDSTIINKNRAQAALSDIKTGDQLVVIGTKNADGSVAASRVLVRNTSSDGRTQSQQGSSSAPGESL